MVYDTVVKSRTGEIEWRTVPGDENDENVTIPTEQFPKVPAQYIARLVYDRTHVSAVMVAKP